MNNTSNLWEEKNSIEPTKNLENSGIIVPNDITNEIKNASAKNECEDIGNKKKLNRIRVSKEYYIKNREKIKNKIKLHRHQNHDKLILREKIYRKKNYE